MSTINELLERYSDGKCNDTEKQRVEEWLATHNNYNDKWPEKNEAEQQLWLNNLLEDIDQVIDQREQEKPSSLFRQALPIAALLILITGFACWFFMFRQPENQADVNLAGGAEILPGKNRASLLLADGSSILLNESKNGIQITETGINYTDGSPVKHPSLEIPSFKSAISTLKTPAGGQYQLVLSDGTKIWLNAATSITFTPDFTKLKDRSIGIDGEAYLNVTKNPEQPFVVQSRGQTVKVLGTQFNISSYSDEPAIKTTLLEGAVSVTSGNAQVITLLPGEQAVLREKQLSKIKVNTEKEIDWKEGDFILDDQDLQSIMREVSRWYNVEIAYEGNLQPMTFLGTISRSKKLSSLLEILESNGKVHFKITGKTITVSP